MTETQFEDLPEGKWGSLPTWVTSHIYRGILSQVVEEKGRPVFEGGNSMENMEATLPNGHSHPIFAMLPLPL